jgi:molybdenum cofactor cytidylyltransferase
LLTAFTAHPECDFCVPVVNGQRGNPVVVSRHAVEQILAMDRQVACREFMQQNPQTVWRHVTANDHFITDLDSVADLDALTERTGWAVESPWV